MKKPPGNRELLKLFTFPLPGGGGDDWGEKRATEKLLKKFEGKAEKNKKTLPGRASVSASLFFMSNLVSSVTPLEECESESVQFSNFKVKPQLLKTKT